MTTLPERLAEVMADLGLKDQKELADFCDVSEGLVTQWFQGTTRLGPKPLKAFGRKTNYSLDWLTEGKLPKRRGLEPVIIERGAPINYDAIRRMVEPILKEHGIAYDDLVADEQAAKSRIESKLTKPGPEQPQTARHAHARAKWTRPSNAQPNKRPKSASD